MISVSGIDILDLSKDSVGKECPTAVVEWINRHMKIVFANNYYYLRGGSERVFFDEMEVLKAHGHEVAPFTRHFEKNNESAYSDYFAAPIEYENTSFNKKISASFKLIYSFECRNNFKKLLRDFTPDLVHAHNIYGRLTTSIIDAAKISGIPVVMTIHDYKMICPSYLMLLDGKVCDRCLGGSFYHCIVQRCHKGSLAPSAIYTVESYFNRFLKKYDYVRYFISPSVFLLKKHIEGGMPEEKMIHIPNFINTATFKPNYNNGGYILFVGRLSKEKGVLTLLRAVKGLDMLVRIVGDGHIRCDCEQYVKENGLNNVVFEGYKSGTELMELFMNAAFLVFPSEWYENAPMTILEAFTYGKPVIGSNIGGIPEIVVEEETGLLFKTGDHEELRDRIVYLLSNPVKVQEMGKKARDKVEKEHNANIHYNKLMDVYNRSLL